MKTAKACRVAATLALAVFALALSTGAAADDASDREFLVHAGQLGLAEVELGRIAEGRAASARVKRFAGRMVRDHAKSNEELRSLAGGKGVELPSTLAGQHRANAEKLGRLSGAEFDRHYMEHMVTDHRKAVAEFEKAARDARDSRVKAFASKTLPHLREHLKMAQATMQGLGPGNSATATPNTGGSGSGSTPPTETRPPTK
ncbi:MAG TPA: DUF4142 domain-containing protein [Usitatibacter sp.]|nr:DUF4142 domain-containing protein [Usitatibacter sp.]